jgi:salicylate hydroxylase
MRDSAAQKESIASGKGSVHGSAEWVWGFDPVAEWDKPPSVPGPYAA